MLQLLEHPLWEPVTHLAVVALYVYVFYLMYQSSAEINVSNLLLLIIALSIGVLMHQNINLRNGAYIPEEVIQQMEEERNQVTEAMRRRK